jgi:hypothetical protein
VQCLFHVCCTVRTRTDLRTGGSASKRCNCLQQSGKDTLRLACRFEFCAAEKSEPWCPPGMNINEGCPDDSSACHSCPAHRDCYVACSESEWGTWVSVEGSSYNDLAFCERFPYLDTAAPGAPGDSDVYAAQTGKAIISRHNFDNIYWSVITIFQILTGLLLCQSNARTHLLPTKAVRQDVLQYASLTCSHQHW